MKMEAVIGAYRMKN